MIAVKAVASLPICASLPEPLMLDKPLLLDNAINTKISYAGSVTVIPEIFASVLFSRYFAYFEVLLK